ncbi:MAG: hypothetical protein AAF637_16340 [Pseudomonadota bacterium]
MTLSTSRRGFLATLGAASLFGLLGPGWRRHAHARDAADNGIWQQIWDADQSERGIPAILVDQRGDPEVGFVRVDEPAEVDSGHQLFAEVVIPEHKRLTYDLCRELFDNYRLNQTEAEDMTRLEARETLALLDAITDSAPMQVACAHLADTAGLRCSRDAWQEVLFNIWFRPFDLGRNRDLTGFEHVVVGERKGDQVSGYHFWYKYYLDDLGALTGEDAIDWRGTRYDGPRRRDGALNALGRTVPEIATLAYDWDALDPETGYRALLEQNIGGFWIGCSVEGLMALGTLRFFAPGSSEAVINGARYRIDLHRSDDGQSLRTFFPRFLGLA